jgi:hypothetical protein
LSSLELGIGCSKGVVTGKRSTTSDPNIIPDPRLASLPSSTGLPSDAHIIEIGTESFRLRTTKTRPDARPREAPL